MSQTDVVAPTRMDVTLNFLGPFTFTGGERCLFESSCAAAAGIYLWTIRQRSDQSHLIHYVGQTTGLASRQREHLYMILGLHYGIFDPEKAQDGVCDFLWRGLWREKSPDGPSKLIDAYHAIHDQVVRYLPIVNIFFAELKADDRLRKHIEGCIGWNLRNNHPEFKALYPDDNHVGSEREKNRGELRITVSEHIRGLDSRIPY